MPGDVIESLKNDAYSRAPQPSRAETEALLPDLTTLYKAAGTPDNGEISRLVLVMGKDGFKPEGTAYYFLQYVHLSMGEFGFWDDGQWFTFIWSDVQPKLVIVRGRNLLRITDYISLRRLPWIRQADRDFRGAVPRDEPIITRIEIRDWVRPPEGGPSTTGFGEHAVRTLGS
jgi:hypothetical protein